MGRIENTKERKLRNRIEKGTENDQKRKKGIIKEMWICIKKNSREKRNECKFKRDYDILKRRKCFHFTTIGFHKAREIKLNYSQGF